jgi:hypothetical protein
MTNSDNDPSFPDESTVALEVAALLGEEFEIETLLALGVSAETLDPLFDSGVLEEADAGGGSGSIFG